MLVENRGSIVTFRVSSGDEILGELEEMSSTHLTIKTPAITTLVPMGNGQVQVNLGSFMTASYPDSTIKFRLANVICDPIKARPEAEEQYRRVMVMPKQ